MLASPMGGLANGVEALYHIIIYVYTSILDYNISPSSGNEMSKSQPAAHRSSAQTIQTIHSTADSTSCTGLGGWVLHPVHGGRSPIRPQQRSGGILHGSDPAHGATAQCKQSEKGTHALSAGTAPRVLLGSYLH